MISSLALTVFFPVALLVLSTLWTLIVNYFVARNVGLPIIIVPISPENPIWMILARHILPLIQRIPFGTGYFSRFCHVGWEFDEKSRAHLELGDAFMFVTPGKNWVYLCNADTVSDINRRERQGECARPVELLAMLDVFGPNLSTVHGQDWQRQRKCTAASFTEHTNAVVWAESIRQGQQAIAYWKSTGDAGVRSTARDSRTLALDILLRAGFGKSFDFQGHKDKCNSTGPLSYRDALAMVLENAILILALGPKLIQQLAFIPGLGQLSRATIEFKQYMINLFEESKRDGHLRAQKTEGNLLTSLVEASVQDKLISQDEVLGNMFVFNFAGHDTTAHSLAYTFMLLTAHPNVQDWRAEEINHVVKGDDPLQWSYDLFPKLNRTLAVMYETLRLFDPLLSIVKGTESQPARLKIKDNEYLVPAHTRIILNLNALHSYPRYWGDDGLEWNPLRWITVTSGDGPSIDREQLTIPNAKAFIPWGEGMRACPGKKFAQVEHVGLMTAIFRDHYVVPVKEAGEDDAQARARVQDIIQDTGMKLLLQMLHPERAALEWRKRS